MSDTLRVVFVSHLSDLSGATRCLLQVLRSLDCERFEPIAVCPGPGPLVRAILDLGIPVYVVPKFPPSKWWGMRCGASKLVAKLAYRLTYVVTLSMLFRRCRAQVAFLNTLLSSGATIAARLNRLRVVAGLHEYRLRFSLTSPIRRWVVLHGAHHLITNSDAVKTVAVEYGADPTRVTVAYTGIDKSRFVQRSSVATIAQRQMWGAPPNGIVFGAVGALVRNKGFQDFIAAAGGVSSVLHSSRFVIAGSVPEGEDTDFALRLEEQVSALGLQERVRFLGQVADMALFYSAVDVLVVPSHDESLSLVALEAMFMTKPVIGTVSGGLVEVVVPERTGLLVPPHQPDELITAMVKLGRDQALRHRMGQAGAGRVRQVFAPESYAAAVEKVLASVVCMSEEI